jgi:hypothetical protein
MFYLDPRRHSRYHDVPLCMMMYDDVTLCMMMYPRCCHST